MSEEITVIQYLRGVAAILVVIHHLSSSSAIQGLSALELGNLGVGIFFVISGFIMWRTTQADPSPMDFWRRRIIRVVPLYWFFLLLIIAIDLSGAGVLHSTTLTAENVAKSFLFIPHFHAAQKDIIAPILIPGWSLNYEMFFYLIFGLVLLLESKTSRAIILTVLFPVLVLLGFAFHPQGAVSATYTNYVLLGFPEGIALAVLYPSLHSRVAGIVLAISGLVLWLVVSGDLGVVLAPPLIVAGALACGREARSTRNRLLHIIGDASYSIYLSHLFFLRLSIIGWRHLVSINTTAQPMGYVVLTLIFATSGGIAVFFFVERPMLLLLRRTATAMPLNPSV